MRKVVIIITLVLITTLGGCFYWARLIFSESLRIEADETIRIAVLVPDLLKDKALTSLGQVNYYYYSAGDGPKPALDSVNITLNKEDDHSEIEQKVRAYFQNKGFVENDKGELSLDEYSVEITFGIPDENSIDIALVRFLWHWE